MGGARGRERVRRIRKDQGGSFRFNEKKGTSRLRQKRASPTSPGSPYSLAAPCVTLPSPARLVGSHTALAPPPLRGPCSYSAEL